MALPVPLRQCGHGLSFLKAAAKDGEYRWPKFTVIDTAKLARRILTRDEVLDCKLGTLAEFFNTSVSPTHRALDDAMATVDVLHALIGRVGSLGITTLEELKDEVFNCPPVLLITGRKEDAWLAAWSRAESVVTHPIDPFTLAQSAAALLRKQNLATTNV